MTIVLFVEKLVIAAVRLSENGHCWVSLDELS